MSGLITQSFSINLTIMRICHLYPPKKPNNFFKIRSYILQVMFVLPIPVLGILYLFLEDNLDIDRVNYNAAFLVHVTCFITKLLPFVMNGQRIRKCIDFFEHFSKMVTQDSHKISTEDCIRICRRNTFIYLISTALSVCAWATKPIFWNGKNLPVDVWLPFYPFDNVLVYCCIYVLLVAGVTYGCAAAAAIDPLIAGLAYQATNQIKILKDNLENLSKYIDIKQRSNDHTERGIIIDQKVKQCVIHHMEILRFITEFQICFSPVAFSQLCSNVFVICFSCLQLIKVESLGFNFFQLVMYFISIFAQLYFYCYYGSELTDESNTINHAIYNSNWYSYDTRCKKALLIFMERCQKPNVVTAGKLLDLSLDTFTMILKRSYSLVAVLKNYQ